jgi:hypothetical protein
VISVVPAAIAVTKPEVEFTVATEGFELAHVPSAVPLVVNDAVSLMHNEEVPLIDPAMTGGDTVNVLKEETGLPQPVLTV